MDKRIAKKIAKCLALAASDNPAEADRKSYLGYE
jgi:hypothetical protein